MTIKRTMVKLCEHVLGPRFVIKQRVRAELKTGEVELTLLPLLSEPSKTFVDIGANKGVYAFYAESFFGQVIAIEANPSLAVELGKALGPKSKVIDVALSDQQGSGRLWIPVQGTSDIDTRSSLESTANDGFEQRQIEVPLITLDKLNLKNVAVIKIDVEGHEINVLQGSIQTLTTNKPTIIVECEERHNKGAVERLFSLLKGIGFSPWYLHRRSIKDGDSFDVTVLQNESHAKSVNGQRSPDYINNFVFIHRDRDEVIYRLRRAFP